LAHTLKLLFASNAEEINIVAQSMGNWVTVEAMRQIEIAAQISHNGKFGSSFLPRPISIWMFQVAAARLSAAARAILRRSLEG
jgi:hypothetical protein